jgi:hypothetical protein
VSPCFRARVLSDSFVSSDSVRGRFAFSLFAATCAALAIFPSPMPILARQTEVFGDFWLPVLQTLEIELQNVVNALD